MGNRESRGKGSGVDESMDMSSTGSFYSKLHSTRVQAHSFEASNVSSHALSERSRSRGFQRLALDRLASLFCQKQPNRT